MNGGVFKRCGCRHPQTGRPLDTACPRLSQRAHGSWYFDGAVKTVHGRRERVRRGGYLTRRDAATARDALLNGCDEGRAADAWTVGRWLRYWLTTRTSIRPSTLRSYTEHVELHLIPHLGRTRLGELTGRHVADMIATLSATDNRYGRPPTPSTLHRIRATLRSALNAAIREGLLRDNPARFLEMPSPRRPQAQVWTNARVQAWRETGQRYPVAVWTVQQTAGFLNHVDDDRLFAMWWLIALRGLRRGEAAGLRWVDVDLTARVVMIGQQRIAYGNTVAVGPPKTAASRRTIALDPHTVQALRAHRRRQQAEQQAVGEQWHETGYVFTTPHGQPLHPDYLTRRFTGLVKDNGLPPVRLHDLRHGAASLAHCAGVDLKTVQEQLGHTSIVLTADTYTGVLHEQHIKAAAATARLILAAAAHVPGTQRPRRSLTRQKSAASPRSDQPNIRHSSRSSTGSKHHRGRPHTPHLRPTKIKTA